MPRFSLVRGMLVAALVMNACAKKRSGAPRPDATATAVTTLEASVSRVMDAAPMAQELRFASIDELFGLKGDEPPETLAGFRLGDRLVGEPFRRLVVSDFEGNAKAFTRTDGTIRHVVVELNARTVATDSQDATLEAAELRLRARWGKPADRSTRHRWRGARAQLFVGEYGGFLRGSPSMVVDLLPAGEEHVCGAKDGFAEFFTDFGSALRHKDRAVAAMLDGRDDDMAACTGTAAEWLACVEPVIARLHRDKARPVCNLSAEVYWWSTVEELHGGTYFTFARSADGTWKAHGPSALGHDDDLDPLSP